MDLSHSPPLSPVSPLSETTNGNVNPKAKSYVSCRTSTGIPRASFITISSQSITVFADVNDLPSGSVSHYSQDHAPKVDIKHETPHTTLKRQSHESIDSISSFGFEVSMPEPVFGGGRVLTKPHLHRDHSVRQDISRQESIRSLWRSKITGENNQSLREIFPHPPSKGLLNFATVFPEIAHEKQPACMDKSLPPPPYHVFDTVKKKRIMVLMAVVGVLTPMSTFIYFPILGDISRAFHINSEYVLLTIAVHMAVQGTAPLLWMPLGDYFGRRLVIITTLSIFVGSNIGLLFSGSFLSLMLLRAAQAFGSADLPIVGAAVIADISTGAERGYLITRYGSVLMFGHVLSPVLGGVLTHFFDFRSIFWFQIVLGGLALCLVGLFLPETLRNIAGNGTIKLNAYQQPLVALVKSSHDARFNSNPETIIFPPTIKSFVEPLYLLSHLDLLGSIIFGAIAFATAVVVISTTALCLESYYRLSTLLVGIAFLPSAAGTLLGFFVISYLLERDNKIIESCYKFKHDIEEDSKLSFKDESDFPRERARLRNIWWITLIFIGATIGYGFSLPGKHIAVPLVMQFLVGFGATAILLANGVLISDLCPDNLASVTSIINFVRYSMGAVAVGVVQFLFWHVDTGFSFLIFAMATLAVTPILVLQWMFGVKWRTKDTLVSGEGSFLESVKAVSKRKLVVDRLSRWNELWKKATTNVSSTR